MMTEQKTKFDEVTRKRVQQVAQASQEVSTKLWFLDLKFETFATPSLVGFAFLAWMVIGCSANAPTESEPVTPAVETTPNGTPADPQPVATSPVVESAKTPEASNRETLFIPIMTVVNFPSDYVCETFNRQLWIAPFNIQKGDDGTWRLRTQDGAISNRGSAPDLGQFYLDESGLNFLITEAQAREISGYPAEKFFNCSFTFTIEKQRIGRRDYFVTVFFRESIESVNRAAVTGTTLLTSRTTDSPRHFRFD